jgi:hypothetical protein
MMNDMFGIDARRYAALAGLIHGGTCNPARWAGLRNVAPLARRDSLQPHTVGWAETYRAVGACGQVAAQVSAIARLRAAQRASLAQLDTLSASLQHRVFR